MLPCQAIHAQHGTSWCFLIHTEPVSALVFMVQQMTHTRWAEAYQELFPRPAWHAHHLFASHLSEDYKSRFPHLFKTTKLSIYYLDWRSLAIVLVSEGSEQGLCKEILLTYPENIKIRNIAFF